MNMPVNIAYKSGINYIRIKDAQTIVCGAFSLYHTIHLFRSMFRVELMRYFIEKYRFKIKSIKYEHIVFVSYGKGD